MQATVDPVIVVEDGTMGILTVVGPGQTLPHPVIVRVMDPCGFPDPHWTQILLVLPKGASRVPPTTVHVYTAPGQPSGVE
jgi:hypothetical protein